MEIWPNIEYQLKVLKKEVECLKFGLKLISFVALKRSFVFALCFYTVNLFFNQN